MAILFRQERILDAKCIRMWEIAICDEHGVVRGMFSNAQYLDAGLSTGARDRGWVERDSGDDDIFFRGPGMPSSLGAQSKHR
eukprot:2301654-Pyramimonas_sp.AAC.1